MSEAVAEHTVTLMSF